MKRITAFDGLRALAVLAVLVQHSFFGEMNLITSPGPVGVRLFFVLSGFLITGILVGARREAEVARVSMGSVWRAFLGRRAVRIFPLAYVAMGLAWLLGAPAMREHGIWYWSYLGNIHAGFFGQSASNVMTYWWSLAVEEQFYLFWPLVILFLPRRAWQPVTVALFVIAPVTRMVQSEATGAFSAYVLPWCRMDALAFGALLS